MPLFKPNINAMKQKRDVRALLETMATLDAQLKREARQAILDIGKPAFPTLVDILLNDRILPSVQTEVVEMMVVIRDESLVDVLMRAVEMSRKRELAKIEQATFSQDRTYRLGFYVNQIATSEGLFRNAIANALGKVGGLKAVQALFKMMTEEQGAMASNIQTVIKESMGEALQSADHTVIRQLSEMMPSGSTQARVMVANCLTQVGGDEAVAELMEIAADEREEFAVRAEAIAGIGKIGDRRIISTFEELQYSGNRTLVREVQGALESIRMRCPPPPIE
jgi:HEAT repeat protein